MNIHYLFLGSLNNYIYSFINIEVTLKKNFDNYLQHLETEQ